MLAKKITRARPSADELLSGARREYYETHLPLLQGLSAQQRAELAAQARPGESWEQLVARVEQERTAAFQASLTPCRICDLTEHYQTQACQQMGICDACNAALEAELSELTEERITRGLDDA